MGAVKESIMAMGERGYIPVSDQDVARWQGCVERALPVANVTIEVRGRSYEERGLPWDEAHALANDQRIGRQDRDSIIFLLEVAGLD